jgi:hypothetical protein
VRWTVVEAVHISRGEPIDPDTQEWNRDHVSPPRGLSSALNFLRVLFLQFVQINDHPLGTDWTLILRFINRLDDWFPVAVDRLEEPIRIDATDGPDLLETAV